MVMENSYFRTNNERYSFSRDENKIKIQKYLMMDGNSVRCLGVVVDSIRIAASILKSLPENSLVAYNPNNLISELHKEAKHAKPLSLEKALEKCLVLNSKDLEPINI